MKVVNIIGGLGNQLFQYAFALSLQQAFSSEDVKICTKGFKGYPLHNGYELDDIFDIKIPKASIGDLCKVAYPFLNYRMWQFASHYLPQRSTMIHEKEIDGSFNFNLVSDKSFFDGYWGSPKFIEKYRNIIKDAYVFPDIKSSKNIDVLKFINNQPTAFIHVRRGDYLTNKSFCGICDEQYYKKAIEYLKIKHNYRQYLIFSNDIEWCINSLSYYLSGSSTIFVDWNTGKDSYIDMQLMSECDAGVIANSTFSWWGAWLGNLNVIIRPRHWTNNQQNRIDIFPSSWISV